MLRKLRPRSIYDVMAAIGCFAALATGSAYAADTVFSTDIVDGEVKSIDIGNNEVNSADVKDQSLTTFDVSTFLGADVVDGTLTSADIQDFSLGNGDFLTGSVDGRVVTDNSITSADVQLSTLQGSDIAADTLTGADINESTLNLPQTPTTATFASTSPVALSSASAVQVLAKSVPAGSYAVVATASITTGTFTGGSATRSEACELRNGSSFIGGAHVRGYIDSGQNSERSLSMNGGAQVPAGGGTISMWCTTQNAADQADGQMMIIRLDGFF